VRFVKHAVVLHRRGLALYNALSDEKRLETTLGADHMTQAQARGNCSHVSFRLRLAVGSALLLLCLVVLAAMRAIAGGPASNSYDLLLPLPHLAAAGFAAILILAIPHRILSALVMGGVPFFLMYTWSKVLSTLPRGSDATGLVWKLAVGPITVACMLILWAACAYIVVRIFRRT